MSHARGPPCLGRFMSIRKSAIALIILALTSCHPGVVLDWFNDSGQRLIIVNTNARGEELSRSTVKQGRVLRTGIPQKLRIEHPGGTWNYDPPAIPDSYLWHKGSMVSKIRLQIQPDGTVFVMLPRDKGPLNTFSTQPPGYPVHPTNSKP